MKTVNSRKASMQVFLLIAILLFSFSPGGSNAAQAVVDCSLSYSLTLLTTTGGSPSATPGPDCPNAKYSAGSVVTLTANPNPGYGFWRWTGSATSNWTANPTTITMTLNDKTVTANFVLSPAHDNFFKPVTVTSPRRIDNITYEDLNVNVTGATTQNFPNGADPDAVGPCEQGKILNQGNKTVWYSYTNDSNPPIKESISLDTAGSDYETYIAVWTGDAENLTLAKKIESDPGSENACNHVTINGYSELIFIAEPGQTYYIEIAEYNGLEGGTPGGNYGGTLQFHAFIRNVQVEIGGLLMDTYLVGSGERITPSYPGVANGPVRVHNPTTESIIASERAVYNNGFQDTLGFPANQLTTKYWFPWYDYAGMSSWIIVGNTSATQAANVEIYIAGAFKESKSVEPNGRWTPSYPGVASGPVEVRCTNCSGDNNIFTSQRILYNGGFQETLGYPDNKLTSTYWFPWYDYAGMASWIVVGNTSATQKANVEIYIAGAFKEGKSIDPNGQWVPSYPGVATGPVEVRCTNCSGDNNIFTSQRIIYNGRLQETLGFPATDLTSKYWYTWYDYAGMASWIVIGNTSATQAANVEIYIAGAFKESKSIDPNGRWAPSYPGVATGPVEVRCTNCSGDNNIFTSQRILYNNYVKETLGYPDTQLTSDYWFPWYDYAGMATWIIIANP